MEVNHELIRRVLPKGTSFNNLTQEDINLMMNHINSYKKKLNNRSPYEVFSFYHGEEVLHKLGCAPVAASDIMLKPTLLTTLISLHRLLFQTYHLYLYRNHEHLYIEL